MPKGIKPGCHVLKLLELAPTGKPRYRNGSEPILQWRKLVAISMKETSAFTHIKYLFWKLILRLETNLRGSYPKPGEPMSDHSSSHESTTPFATSRKRKGASDFPCFRPLRILISSVEDPVTKTDRLPEKTHAHNISTYCRTQTYPTYSLGIPNQRSHEPSQNQP